MFPRRRPLLSHVPLRTALGFVVTMAAVVVVSRSGDGNVGPLAVAMLAAWLPAVLLTDKYLHKYPQRYYTYLVATHAKAAAVSAMVLEGIFLFGPEGILPLGGAWQAFALGFVSDALLSVPSLVNGGGTIECARAVAAAAPSAGSAPDSELRAIDTSDILGRLPADRNDGLAEFLKANLPASNDGIGGVLAVGRDLPANVPGLPGDVGLVYCTARFNDIRRLNRFFLACGDRLPAGGYLAGRYVSHETLKRELKERFPNWLLRPARFVHFVWYRAMPKLPGLNRIYFMLTDGRNRLFSKVEIWGRLSYCGMRVVAEAPVGRDTALLAQRVGNPVSNRRPSYYPVVALEKVGLDGAPLRTHKLRSMFPFSEFLQKRIFEDHGLAATGKFANDYRLTEYGTFIRRYWLDELPQVFDWIRGDVKLVGMRATSRHYLSLYPPELYDLYIQTKPGLIPPIFDDSTPGFDGVVAVELAYLQRYWQSPLRTDARYLLRTFTDIFLRGVRSK
jgi:lipopolysaccharide/colanic/teichoic acid biosynthesis glycosyltransferase